MENKLRKHNTHTCLPNSHPPALAMHKDSQTISKTKPKIRIIHIFAPQIIKTDVENFRELVQMKTGKPSGQKCCNKKKPTTLAGTAGRDDKDSRRSNSGNSLISGISDDDKPKSVNKRMKLRSGAFWGLDQCARERSSVKEEEALRSDEISSGGYLGGLSDLEEGFISEPGEFPPFPLDCSHVQGSEESQSQVL